MAGMKLWKPLLVVLPAGLLLGIIGGRMVDSGNPRDAQEGALAQAEAVNQAALDAAQPEEWPAPAAADGRLPAVPDQRPQLDWTAEFAPQDDGGAYDYDGDYFGAGRPALGGVDDTADEAGSGSGASRPFARDSEAAAAARSAGQAARDAAGIAAAAPTRPVAAAPAPAPAPAPVSEPRTADGDLPAIW